MARLRSIHPLHASAPPSLPSPPFLPLWQANLSGIAFPVLLGERVTGPWAAARTTVPVLSSGDGGP